MLLWMILRSSRTAAWSLAPGNRVCCCFERSDLVGHLNVTLLTSHMAADRAFVRR
jgi:hypothetical protein